MPTHPAVETSPSQVLSPRLAFVVAAVSGLIVANMYYAQPLVGLIGAYTAVACLLACWPEGNRVLQDVWALRTTFRRSVV